MRETGTVLQARLRDLLDEPIDWRYKALPPVPDNVTLGTLGQQGWNVLDGDLLFPVMVLKTEAMEHNLEVIARFCSGHGISLAPHGKTTMAPQIFNRQLELGAWAMTAATISQARIYRAFGIERILLANELVDPAGLRWVVEELAADPSFSLFCLVDSEDGVRIMDQVLDEARPKRRIEVLVELGAPGMRAGSRSGDEAMAVAAAVSRSPYLDLAGVEGYEGVIGEDRSEDVVGAVDHFLERLWRLTSALDRQGAFEGRDEIVVSAGGSAWFDLATAHLLSSPTLSKPLRFVLRAGCYVTHDDGLYERVSPLRSGGGAEVTLRPALELFGEVLSRPEPELAIVGFGKRDAPHDLDLPIPRILARRSGEQVSLDGELKVFKMMDQHAYVRVQGVEVDVGDVLRCGISHPCTAFNKWRLIPLVNDEYRVVGGVRTFF